MGGRIVAPGKTLMIFGPWLTLCLAGAINAGFALPMKFMRRWSWENTWLVWSCFALLIFPLALAALTIPNFPLLLLLQRAALMKMVLFGALWGAGQVLFGLALDAIGISLATLIMLGVSTGIGTLVPMMAAGGGETPVRMLTILAALALAIGGVVLCAFAGRGREADRRNAARGIACAVAAGLGAGLFNFSMAFGGTLVEQALRAGCAPAMAQLAAWAPFLAAGSVANLGYCGLRLRAHGSYRNFTRHASLRYWLGGILMAALWLGSALLYGAAVGQIGRWGAIFAWPIYMSLIVLGTFAVGAMTGEWRRASRRSRMLLGGGLVALVFAVVVITCVQQVAS